ncbi:MAG: hypothetical protein K8I29_17530 [Alphaproteobacteria bacterium]|uniref:DUF5666 domain-containing protein n=1 Tax=Candidatus Nitrobium versatile TaxID=2884831 RepID=A0A953M318_9BACT|nr:hypothetical protein [Candidatus Nitrobium versatile]
MKMKALIALVVAMVFTLGVAGLSFATDMKGTVTKIDGKKVTIKDAAGKDSTVEVKNAKDVKVGDMVTVKDGTATKEAAPAKKKATSGGY